MAATFHHPLRSWECSRSKVRGQLGVPDAVSIFLGMHSKEFPMLRLAPADEIVEGLKLMAPVAKGEFGGLDIDHAAADGIRIWAHLIIVGQMDVVVLWDELEFHRKNYMITKASPAEVVHERYHRDCMKISAAFLASTDERRAAMLAEAGMP